jgi:hypothetical protein
MKINWLLVPAFALTLGLTACGGGEAPAETPAEEAPVEMEAPAEETPGEEAPAEEGGEQE